MFLHNKQLGMGIETSGPIPWYRYPKSFSIPLSILKKKIKNINFSIFFSDSAIYALKMIHF